MVVPISSSSSSSSLSSGTIHDNNFVTEFENLSLSPSSSAVQVISNFDLLTLILLCLPVKSLMIFKSVCKQWLSVISHPSFVNNHIRRQNLSKIQGFFFQKPWRTADYDYVYDFLLLDGTRIEEEDDSRAPTPEAIASADRCFKALNFDKSCPKPGFHVPPTVEHGMKISQSCNGLLCCTRLTEVDYGIEVPGIFTTHAYIYNPTTRKYRILPPSPFRDVVRDDCCFE
ncbi:hypothetical protein MKX03_014812, partial [Papaver bracteatum]